MLWAPTYVRTIWETNTSFLFRMSRAVRCISVIRSILIFIGGSSIVFLHLCFALTVWSLREVCFIQAKAFNLAVIRHVIGPYDSSRFIGETCFICSWIVFDSNSMDDRFYDKSTYKFKLNWATVINIIN